MTTARHGKGAPIDHTYYSSQALLRCFESICEPLESELHKHSPGFHVDSKELATLIAQLQQFQQDYLGLDCPDPPSPCPLRIPAKLFKIIPNQPLTKNSPLYSICLAASTFRIINNKDHWDFAPSLKNKNAEMIQFIRDFLQRATIMPLPRIGFADNMPDNARKTLTTVARKLQVPTVDNPRHATHILYGDLHEYDSTEEEWFRTLEKDKNKVLVHWWYYPDSYDNWLVQTDQFADPEEPPAHHGPWHIIARWLQDSAKFNELMNEEDYEEVEEIMQIDEPTTPGMSGTNATTTPDPTLSDGPPLPLLNPLYQPGVRIRDLERERPQLGGRQRKNEFEPYSNGDITNISLFTEPYICFPPEDVNMKLEDEPDTNDVNTLAKASPYDYREPPKFPDWFDMESVHELEKFALPEFFENDMNEAAADYKRCRDYMINTYRARPDYYLTIIACKNALNEDLVTLTRIHSFLEHAQLINSEVDPRRKMFDPYVDCDPDAGVQKVGSQRDFVNIGHVDIQYLRDLIYSTTGLEKERSQWNVRVEDDTNPDARKTYLCSSCNRDCSEVRYQSLKYKTVQLCADCYLDGKFTSNTWSGEFLRIEKNPEDDTEDDWTDNETLRLLEGVDQFDDDWLAISEHVGTRSKEQCITQFLQLPINDTFLSARLNQQEHGQVPFADQANPVMTMIAFLSGHINPGVGSIAAKAALKSLVQSSKDSSGGSARDDDGGNDEDSNAMQIDDESAFTPEQMRDATRAALTSAVEQARQLAAYENEEVQHWTRLAAKTVVDKLTLKMQQYAELEQSLESEMAEIEKQSVSLQSSIEAFMKQYPPASSSAPTFDGNGPSAGLPPPPPQASSSSTHPSTPSTTTPHASS